MGLLPAQAAGMTGAGVIVVERSANLKTGPCAVTYASLVTCPSSCPRAEDGSCFAQHGPCGWVTRRASASTRSPLEIAQAEADLILQLPGGRPLRPHISGDCSSPTAAAVVGGAMVAYQRRHGWPAWTMTHAWRSIDRQAWGGARVLASVESVADGLAALARGYGVALVATLPGCRRRDLGGLSVLPCPHEARPTAGVQCFGCRACARAADTLTAVAFRPKWGA